MSFYVYMLLSTTKHKKKTYVGYTIDLKKRLKAHNENRGAKSTKGYNWKLIYKKKYIKKNVAMKNEYRLKNNRKLRKLITDKFNEKNS